MKKYLWEEKYSLLFSTLLALFCSLLNVLIIYSVENIVDSMTAGQLPILRRMIIVVVGLLITNFLFGYLSAMLEAKISRKLHLGLKKDLFHVMLEQKYKDFKKTSVATKLSVFENDMNFIEEYYFNNVFVLMRNIIVIVVAVIYLFHLSVLMGIILIICAVTILFIPLLLGKNIDYISKAYIDCKEKFIRLLKDYCEGMDVIHAYNIEMHVQKNYITILEQLENKLLKLKKKLGLYNQTMISGNYLIIAISFSVGGFFVIKKAFSLGELIAITQIINIIMQPIGEVATALIEIRGSLAVRKNLERLIREKNKEIYKKPDFSKTIFCGIDCRDLSYYTEDGTFSLKKITMKFEPGKKYILIGPSGSGKSTFLKIIANLLEPTLGNAYINDLNYIENEDLVSDMVSLVYQDTFIFNDTIENNIRLYQDCSPREFDNAISVVALEKKLKERIQSDCSECGSNLSGGEKQRIAIARAILQNSPVLLLDEITSSLDKFTAKRIVENLFAMKEKTIVFVTHKMETDFLRRADCIICMNQGTIIEFGTWTELINEKGYFYKLYAVEEE